jgi:hypothetical protein
MNRIALAKKCGLLAGAVMLISAMAASARDRDVPPGSYLETCRNAHIEGDRLVADCLRRDGSVSRSVLDLDRCEGGIANLDGRLTCNWKDHHRDDDRR